MHIPANYTEENVIIASVHYDGNKIHNNKT